MEKQYVPWVDRWLDHLLDAYDHDIPAILAGNAQALELGETGDLPTSVLPLFNIDLEALRSDPEWAARRLQASYAATFRVIKEMLGEPNPGDGVDQGNARTR